MKKIFEPTEKQKDLLRMTASADEAVAAKARKAFAQVLQGAFRAAVLADDTLGEVYEKVIIPAGAEVKFPLHFLSPGEEEDRIAFVMPKEGAIPQRMIEGDEVYVPTYVVANSIDWPIRYARDARWDVIQSALDVYRYGFVRRFNDDGWHTMIQAAVANGRVVDAAASAGVFTKLLLTGMMVGIKRLAGGRASKITDLYMSPEGLADIRHWVDSQLDQETRREVQIGRGPAGVPSLYGINLRELQELGEGQSYQTYIAATDGGNKASWFTGGGGSDVEFCIGLDLSNRPQYPFKMPIREDVVTYEDETLKRSARNGIYGWCEIGFCCLDGRYSIIGTF